VGARSGSGADPGPGDPRRPPGLRWNDAKDPGLLAIQNSHLWPVQVYTSQSIYALYSSLKTGTNVCEATKWWQRRAVQCHVLELWHSQSLRYCTANELEIKGQCKRATLQPSTVVNIINFCAWQSVYVAMR
jgi:hypothetical protein